jgi:glycosyltransferase involved in cell wall biosynthesis
MAHVPGTRNTARAGKVSVVIPARDAASTVGQAVRSAARQTLPPAEIIVVDDASGDATAAAAAEAYAGVRVMTGAGRGVARARNLGVEAASGEWVGFLDADDHWEPGLLEAAMKAIEARPGALACFAAATPVNDAGRVVGRHDMTTTVSLDDIVSARVVPTTSATVVSREALLELGGFYGDFAAPSGVEDLDLWMRMALHGHCVGVPTPLATYVVHDERDRRRSREALLALEGDRELAVDRLAAAGAPAPLVRRARAVMRARTAHYWLRAGLRRDARRMALLSLRTKPTRAGAVTAVVAVLPTALVEGLRDIRRRWRSIGRNPAALTGI